MVSNREGFGENAAKNDDLKILHTALYVKGWSNCVVGRVELQPVQQEDGLRFVFRAIFLGSTCATQTFFFNLGYFNGTTSRTKIRTQIRPFTAKYSILGLKKSSHGVKRS